MGTVSLKQLYHIQGDFIPTDFGKSMDFVKSEMQENSSRGFEDDFAVEEGIQNFTFSHPSGVQESTTAGL